MKRKRWAEAHVWWSSLRGLWFAEVERSGRFLWYRYYSHRRSARRAAIQWAKREGYTLRWI